MPGHTLRPRNIYRMPSVGGVSPLLSRFVGSANASRLMRCVLFVSAILPLAALVMLAVFAVEYADLWRPPDYLASVGAAVAALLGGWLLARTLAKSFGGWHETGGTVFVDTAGLLAGLAVFALLFPLEFRPFWGFLAGNRRRRGASAEGPRAAAQVGVCAPARCTARSGQFRWGSSRRQRPSASL